MSESTNTKIMTLHERICENHKISDYYAQIIETIQKTFGNRDMIEKDSNMLLKVSIEEVADYNNIEMPRELFTGDTRDAATHIYVPVKTNPEKNLFINDMSRYCLPTEDQYIQLNSKFDPGLIIPKQLIDSLIAIPPESEILGLPSPIDLMFGMHSIVYGSHLTKIPLYSNSPETRSVILPSELEDPSEHDSKKRPNIIRAAVEWKSQELEYIKKEIITQQEHPIIQFEQLSKINFLNFFELADVLNDKFHHGMEARYGAMAKRMYDFCVEQKIPQSK